MLDGLFASWRTNRLSAASWLPLLSALLLTVSHPTTLPVQATVGYSATAPAATVITVNTSADLDSGSLTKTCTYTAVIYVAAGDGCTLRRAILEAAARPQSDRPIAIQYRIPDRCASLDIVGTTVLTDYKVSNLLDLPSYTPSKGR